MSTLIAKEKDQPITREEAGFEFSDWGDGWQEVNLESILSDVIDAAIDETEKEIDIITFCESPLYLGQTLKPVQAVVLKTYYGIPLDDKEKKIHLRFFPHDEEGEWLTEKEYVKYLIQQNRTNIPDVDDDIELSTELILACGRRFGKTFIAAVISAYEAYKLIIKGDPQKYYGLLGGRKLKIVSMATSSSQALELADQAQALILNSPWFERYVAGHNSSEIRLRTKKDLELIKSEKEKFGKPRSLHATIKIEAIACTARGSRGGTVIVAILDEIAHFVDNKGNRSGSSIYDGLSPAITDFGMDGKIISISSPWTKSGIFWDLYSQSVPNDEDEFGDQNIRMFRIPTWESRPDLGFRFFESRHKRNPDTFRTEYGAEFVVTVSPFFEYPEKINEVVDDTIGMPQVITGSRIPHTIAIDPSAVSHGYALCMVHPEVVVEEIIDPKTGKKTSRKVEKIFVDDWRRWLVTDPEFSGPLENEIIDPSVIDDYIIAKLHRRVRVGLICYDQFDSTASLAKFKKMGIPTARTAFSRGYNMKIFKRLKRVIYTKKLVLPEVPEAIAELKALESVKVAKKQFAVQAPATGETITDDFADVLANAVYQATERNLKFGVAQVTGTNGAITYQGGAAGTPTSHSAIRARQLRNGTLTNLEQARRAGNRGKRGQVGWRR